MCERKPYTPEQDAFISQHYYTTTDGDIAKHLGRTVKSIRKRARRIGLGPKKPNKRWTKQEDEFIQNNLCSGLAGVAETLGRDPSDVSERARKNGLQFREIRYHEKDGYRHKRIVDENGKRKYIWRHIEVMEEYLGRSLKPCELVHHIDCNKGNNSINNLHLFTSKSEHSRAHRSVETLLPELINRGIVRFNRDEGVYRLCETSE